MPALTPEQRLLVACARGKLCATQCEQLPELLSGPIDWQIVLAQADRHGLKPLLHRHLATFVRQVPKPVIVELWASYEQGLRRNRVMGEELLRIVDRLEAEAIPVLPYKGPTLACLAYGDIGLREFCDLDILVPRAHLERAATLLQASGYSPLYELTPQATHALLRSGAHYHLVFRAAHTVELHWRTDADHPVEREEPDWWDALRREPFLQGTVRGFTPNDLVLVLCLHGSKHRWEALGWLVDVAELLRSHAIDAEALCERARAVGGERRLYLGLRLARDLLQAPIPDALRAGCERADVIRLAATVGNEIFVPPPQGAWGALARELSLHEGPWRQARRAWQVVVLPTLADWTRWPLPRGLFFLYPLLRFARLAAKHLIRSPKTPAAATPRTPPPRPHSTN